MNKPDVRAASRYFEEFKLQPYQVGLAEMSAQIVTTKQKVNVFFIPFAEPTFRPRLLRLVVSSDGPTGPKVLLGTISEEQSISSITATWNETRR